MFAKLRRFFVSYLADGQYNVTFLEETLQKAFENRPLFNFVYLRLLGIKLTVTVIIISDVMLCFFINYNKYSTSVKGFNKS
jgi:hypothetical protein